MAADVLDSQQLNRATLHRQLLLERSALPVLDAVAHLVGMQAQAPLPPYYGLWTRLDGFRPADLADRLLDRSAVRIVLMRSTVHLVTAEDCLRLRPLVQPPIDRDLIRNHPIGVDHREIAAYGRKLLDEKPRTLGQLRPLLAERWPDEDPACLGYAVRSLLPLVQIPPRAVWGRSGQPTYATAETWLGRQLDPVPSLEDMIRRYLRAFGPATVADVQTWSGLIRLREVVRGMELRTFRDEHGRELFDVPDGPLPDPETPAPPRFLPPFDNVLLSHADRTRIMTERHRKRLFEVKNGQLPGTFLVDGFLRGTWEITREGDTAVLAVVPFQRMARRDVAAVAEEGRALLAFAEESATEHDVRFGEPG
ncbi:winged helix DNA-binding domain-containing protein [Saccharopolyspora taberi]|uniref:Winged helix DNA-binding domain-containing protein n=1 Tax=Saccharopolyspora taberi TaxID=60895 RepID=A0ABN3V8T3_9PSEU